MISLETSAPSTTVPPSAADTEDDFLRTMADARERAARKTATDAIEARLAQLEEQL